MEPESAAAPPKQSANERKLVGVHPALVEVILHALQAPPIPFVVFEGVRSAKRQAELVAAGASRTMNSRHLTGHAVDLVPLVGGKPVWAWKPMRQLAPHIKAIAKEHSVVLDWGGDSWYFRNFPDGAHWELSRKYYK